MARRTKDAARAKRYRERRQQNRAAEADPARVEALRQLVRQDAPEDMLLDYLKVSDALAAELARLPQRTRAINELSQSKMRIAEALGVTPRQKTAAGEQDAQTIGEALATAAAGEAARRSMEWAHLKEEVAIFGPKMIGDTPIHRADLVVLIADLKLHRPKLFTADELALTAEELFDAVMATAPSRPPAEPASDEEEELI